MKRYFLPILCLGALMTSCGTKESNDEIEYLLSQMNLEQKVRMLIGSNQFDDESPDDPEDKDRQMMAWAMNSVPGSAASSYSIKDLDIPPIILADGPAGLRIQPERDGSEKTYYCSAFPIGTSLAASFDNKLQEKIGNAMGNEVLEYGVDVLLGPGVNLMRNPLCGRNFEYFSEDPVLSGYSGGAVVRGLQSAGISATLKHYAVNNAETNRCGNDSRVDARTLRELYLKNFALAVREGDPDCIMTSYNYVNGEFASESTGLVEEILRKDIGYNGVVMTDWGAGVDPVKMVRSGNDLIMPGCSDYFEEIYIAAKNGDLPEDIIDRNVRRVLAMVVKSPKWRKYQHSDNPDLKAHADLIRTAGAECCVLLKNEGSALPAAKGSKLALFGTASYEMISGGTGAGDVNKAYMRNLDEGLEQVGINLLPQLTEAYKAHVAAEEIRLADENKARGWWYGKVIKSELPEAVASALAQEAAAEADEAVITICRRSGEGIDRDIDKDFNLREDEIRMIEGISDEFHAQGKKVTVVLNVCGPVRLSDWENKVDAILVAWLPGQEAGYSVADVICGAVNPSGRLPMTFAMKYEDIPSQNFPTPGFAFIPKNTSFYRFAGHPLYEMKDIDYQDYTEGLAVGYRYFTTAGVPVSYPFGHGLSYTSFDKKLSSVRCKSDKIEVKVEVKNTGSAAGKEVVQIYWSNPSIAGEPARQLLCFGKTALLEPGQSQTVVMSVPVDDLAWFSEKDSAWITESGAYGIELCENASTVLDEKSVTVRKRSVRETTKGLYIESDKVFINK